MCPAMCPAEILLLIFAKNTILCVFSSSAHLPSREPIKYSFVALLANYLPLLLSCCKSYYALHPVQHILCCCTCPILISSLSTIEIAENVFYAYCWECFFFEYCWLFACLSLSVFHRDRLFSVFKSFFPDKDKCLVIFCNLIKTPGMTHI